MSFLPDDILWVGWFQLKPAVSIGFMKSQIYPLVQLYCATLTEQSANRVLSEIAKVAGLEKEVPVVDEAGRSAVLRWLDTNHPDAYTQACNCPRPRGWIFDVATIETELKLIHF